MSPQEILTQEARSRGFLSAWAPLELPVDTQARYRNWLEEGKHAGMGFLGQNLESRLEPARRFPWAKSVMVLAVGHNFPDPGTPVGGLRVGKVARYAWVRDYHLVLQPYLTELETIANQLGLQAKGYIDHGPLSERSYGVLGGLGWIGRNAMLMRMGEGTYLTLAVLLTSLDASQSEAYPNRCGRCSSCVQGCPTGALLGDGTLDSRKCISYWIIEHRGLIPAELWGGIGEWLFGCDICQEVCPWNRRAAALWDGFRAESELAHPNLEDFFGLSSNAFARKYEGSVFLRPGRTRMARNALIVLANLGDPAYLSTVRQGALDVNPIVRATAARVLGCFGDLDGVRKLTRDQDPLVADQATRFLNGV